MNHSLVPRMVALALVVVVGVWYIDFDVLHYRIASHPIGVTVEMPSAGGLYAGAGVTYRGVQVGTVSSLGLDTGQVSVHISIDQGTSIPDNGPVYVKELSALGEDYLDLQPASGNGPVLTDGTVIPADRVVLPTPLGTTLVDLGALLKSIAPGDLQTLESFLSSAFIGTGPGLRNIIVTGQQLFNALVAAQPETVNLVVDGQTDLRTLQATDGDLATFTKGLASLTATLRGSDSDLQALIDNTAAASQDIGPFLSANSASITALVRDLGTDAAVTNTYAAQLRAIFDLLPLVSDDLASVAAGGQIHGVITIDTANTVCPYILGASMPGPTQRVGDAPLDNTCSSSASDMLQRGASSSPVYAGGG